MKKQKSLLLQFQSHLPTQGELKTRTLRIKKDEQTFSWLMDSRQGRNLVNLSREILGLPPTGIAPNEKAFLHLHNISNYPKTSEYPKFNPKKLNELASSILRSRTLSDRFKPSIESLLIFGKPLGELPPTVSAAIVIPDFKKPKKELWIRVYPEATFKDDFRAYWHSVVMLQQQLEIEKHTAKWKIYSQVEKESHTNKAIYVRVYKDTVLEDLNNSKFKSELASAFKKADLLTPRFRKWDYKKAIKFLELETGKDSDWDKAEKLYGDEKKRNSVKKLRQKVHRKL
jgi:hypothetical protein